MATIPPAAPANEWITESFTIASISFLSLGIVRTESRIRSCAGGGSEARLKTSCRVRSWMDFGVRHDGNTAGGADPGIRRRCRFYAHHNHMRPPAATSRRDSIDTTRGFTIIKYTGKYWYNHRDHHERCSISASQAPMTKKTYGERSVRGGMSLAGLAARGTCPLVNVLASHEFIEKPAELLHVFRKTI